MAGPAPAPLRLVLTACLVLASGAAGAAPEQQRVGVDAAVNQDAAGTPPGEPTKALIIGANVVYNEHITTGPLGQTQLLFLDESAMTVGPNSDVTIDQFVYDPNRGTGRLAVSAARGVLRFVGGKLSKQEGQVTLATPAARIAVRGGGFIATIGAGGRTEAVFLNGIELRVAGLNGPAQLLLRPDFAVTVSGPGAPPSAPFLEPEQRIANLLTVFDGRTGGHGGSVAPPTNATVANSGLGNVISGNVAANVMQAAQTQPPPSPPRTLDVSNIQTENSVNTVQNQGAAPIQEADQGETQTQTQTQTSPPPTQTQPPPTQTQPPPPPPVTIAYAGGFKSTDGHGTATGFSDQTAQGNSNYAGGTVQNGVFSATLANGDSVSIPLTTEANSFGPAGTTPLGPVYGATYMTSDDDFWFGYLIPANANQLNEREFLYGGVPVDAGFYQPQSSTRFYTFELLPDIGSSSSVPFTLPQYGGSVGSPTVSPLYVVAPAGVGFGSYNVATDPGGGVARGLQASLAISGQGAGQSSVLIINTDSFFTSSATGTVVSSGPVRGSFQPDGTVADQVRVGSAASTITDGNGNALYGGTTIDGFVLDQNSYTTADSPVSQLATAAPFNGTPTHYGFADPALAITSSAGAATPRTSRTQLGWFGGVMYPQSGGIAPYVLSGQSEIVTNATRNTVGAALVGADPFTASASGINSMDIYFGVASTPSVPDPSVYSRSAFINDALFAAAESPQQASKINGTALPLPPNQANAPELGLVSSGAVPTSFTGVAPDGGSVTVTPCQCQYLTWGYWTGQLNQVNGTDTAVTRSDRAFINTWVAGQPTPQADINSLISQTAVGNYAGAAIGSVDNNGASYAAAGNFAAQYNFGTHVGSFQINNFDGHNFAANGTAALTGANYSFGINHPGFAGTVNGTFYGPAAQETGGNFALHATTGAPYLASGIFAGRQP